MTYNKQQLISFINKMCWTFKIKPGDKAGHLISRRWEGPWDVGEYADSLIFFFSLVSDNLITISWQENKNEFAHTEPTIPAVLCWSPEAPFQGRLRIYPVPAPYDNPAEELNFFLVKVWRRGERKGHPGDVLGDGAWLGPREQMVQVQDQNFPAAKQVGEVCVKTCANGKAWSGFENETTVAVLSFGHKPARP